MITLREASKWSLVVATSMGVRLSPGAGQPVHAATDFKMFATSAESNVASISSYLGLPVKVLTSFVKGSPIAKIIKNDLRARGMDFEGPEFDQGGPWGYRHQINIADSGFGLRGPRVHNDRAGEVGRVLATKYFDLDQLFRAEGVGILHMSGLIAALSPETSDFCLQLARAAKAEGTLVSFDINYRESFWKGREAELRGVFTEIASVADILVGNEEDYQLALGVQGPKAGGRDIAQQIQDFKEMTGRIRAEFPGAKVLATTLREVESVGRHHWGALMQMEDTWQVIEPRPIPVLDRIGGGDGFVGGLLYAILRGWTSDKCLQFAWASGALATSFLTDHAQPADEGQVWSVWEGNARVIR